MAAYVSWAEHERMYNRLVACEEELQDTKTLNSELTMALLATRQRVREVIGGSCLTMVALLLFALLL